MKTLVKLRQWCAYQEGYHSINPIRCAAYNAAWRLLCKVTNKEGVRMTRFIAEHQTGISYAIDAPDQGSAMRAAERYTSFNPLLGRVTKIRQPRPLLLVSEGGERVEVLSVTGGYTPLEG